MVRKEAKEQPEWSGEVIDLERLAMETVLAIAAILNDSIEVVTSQEDFYGDLDEIRDLLVARFEEVRDGAHDTESNL